MVESHKEILNRETIKFKGKLGVYNIRLLEFEDGTIQTFVEKVKEPKITIKSINEITDEIIEEKVDKAINEKLKELEITVNGRIK